MARSTASIAVVFMVSFLLVSCFLREASSAVTCGQVVKNLTPCLSYLKTGGTVPPGCCSGVKSLNLLANTTPDRQTACGCLKNLAGSISGLKPGLAAGLPGQCGVNVGYPISTSTDCSKVH